MPEGGGSPMLYAMLACGAGLLCLGILQLIGDLRARETQRVGERLSGYSSVGGGTPAHLLRDTLGSQRSVIARYLGSGGLGAKLRQFLTQADVPWPAHQVISALFLMVLGAILACLLLVTQFHIDLSLLGIAVIVGLTGLLPVVALSIKRSMRLKKLGEQLPELFEMLGQTLRAGHSLVTGIQLCGEQLPDPVGSEFARVYQEQAFGAKLEDSLLSLAKRVGLLDVQMFVTAVLIQRQTGGDLAEVLDKSGAVIRGRIELGRQVKALTAEGRMSGWVLTVLPVFVGLLMYKMNPKYMQELISGDAQFMLKIGIGMNILGFLAIQKLIKIKY